MIHLNLIDLVTNSLEDNKAFNITNIDVSLKTHLAENIIIAEGTSQKHIQSIANNLIANTKDNKITIVGYEGLDTSWALIDLDSIIVHIMDLETRSLYELEKLWNINE